MKRIIPIALIIVLSSFQKSQNKAEENLSFALLISSTYYATELRESEPLTYIVKGINTNLGKVVTFETNYTIKITSSLNQNIVLQPVLNSKKTCTDSMDVGYSTFVFGEMKDALYQRVKKVRIYPPNNIFTEQIKLSNGVILTIEDRLYLREVFFPLDGLFKIREYTFD